jgi:hypothetical protein
MLYESLDTVVSTLKGVVADIKTKKPEHLTWAIRNIDVAAEQLKMRPDKSNRNVKKAICVLRSAYKSNTIGSSAHERWDNTRNNPEYADCQNVQEAAFKAITLLESRQ